MKVPTLSVITFSQHKHNTRKRKMKKTNILAALAMISVFSFGAESASAQSQRCICGSTGETPASGKWECKPGDRETKELGSFFQCESVDSCKETHLFTGSAEDCHNDCVKNYGDAWSHISGTLAACPAVPVVEPVL